MLIGAAIILAALLFVGGVLAGLALLAFERDVAALSRDGTAGEGDTAP